MVYKKDTAVIESTDFGIIGAKEPNYGETLEGKALQVYWYLLTNGTKGIREIQKDLNFSSPSTASYQIKKLIETGIVSKDEGSDKYFVKQEVKSGILGFYIRFGYKMIPRFTIYLMFHFIGIIVFLGFFLLFGVEFLFHPITFIFLLYLLLVTILFVFESYNIWKMKPDSF